MAYNDSWDRPHTPGDSERWQESDCYWFFDVKKRVGGYWRIGQYVNKGTGQAMLFTFKEGGQRFRMLKEFDSADCERTETGQRVGSMAAESLGDGRMQYTWVEPECEADLEFHSATYTPRSWSKNVEEDEGGSTIHDTMNTDGHLEVAGRLKGRIRIGGVEVEIDAFAHRDRSWGERDYNHAWQHRMVTGTVGEQLSWAVMVVQMANGAVFPMGFVARDGETFDVRDLKILTEYDYDGTTVAGVRVRTILEDGSELVIRGTAAQGYMSIQENTLVCSHTIMEVEHNGVSGFTVLDAINTPRKGEYLPNQADLSLALGADGLHDAADYAGLQW